MEKMLRNKETDFLVSYSGIGGICWHGVGS